MMWEEIIRLAVQSGIFAVLFCSLLVYVLKDSRRREQKYQQIIQSLSTSLTALTKVQAELESVEYAVDELAREVRTLSEKEEN